MSQRELLFPGAVASFILWGLTTVLSFSHGQQESLESGWSLPSSKEMGFHGGHSGVAGLYMGLLASLSVVGGLGGLENLVI